MSVLSFQRRTILDIQYNMPSSDHAASVLSALTVRLWVGMFGEGVLCVAVEESSISKRALSKRAGALCSSNQNDYVYIYIYIHIYIYICIDI